MLRVTVALSVWCLLVGWVEMVVAHRRLGRLVLQNMYEHWLAAHPHADTMPRCAQSDSSLCSERRFPESIPFR